MRLEHVSLISGLTRQSVLVRRRWTRGSRSYAGAANVVVPVRCIQTTTSPAYERPREAGLVDTTSTARNDALAGCLIAIELSKASWVVGVQPPLSNKTSQYRLTAGDWKSLLKLIERIRRQVGRELGRTVEVMSCYEAGYDGFWF